MSAAVHGAGMPVAAVTVIVAVADVALAPLLS